jgi:hypothetical protein
VAAVVVIGMIEMIVGEVNLKRRDIDIGKLIS